MFQSLRNELDLLQGSIWFLYNLRSKLLSVSGTLPGKNFLEDKLQPRIFFQANWKSQFFDQ